MYSTVNFKKLSLKKCQYFLENNKKIKLIQIYLRKPTNKTLLDKTMQIKKPIWYCQKSCFEKQLNDH